MASIIGSIFRSSALLGGVKSLALAGGNTKIADIVIDATLNEVIQYGAIVTEHPIETKTAVSDHIFKQPLRLKIEGYITDSPMQIMGLFETPLQKNSLNSMTRNIKKTLPFLSSDKPSRQGYEALKALYQDRCLISVVTKLESFNNMAITSLVFTSNDKTRGKLEFVAELVQVIHAKVATNNVSISNKPMYRLTSEPIDKGNEPLAKSWLKSGFDWAFGS